jgi:hypothetical protein
MEVGKFTALDIITKNAGFIKSCVHYWAWGYDLVGIKVSSVSVLTIDPAVVHIPVFYGPTMKIDDRGIP